MVTFREENVKYDDNPEDTTLVLFDEKVLHELYDAVELSEDIILRMYYDFNPTMFFEKGLYQRLSQMCETDEDRKRLEEKYGFLVDDLNNQ